MKTPAMMIAIRMESTRMTTHVWTSKNCDGSSWYFWMTAASPALTSMYQ